MGPLEPSQPLTALVADDNVDNAQSLAQLLQVLGCDARTSYDGRQAIEAARHTPPDVAFIDLNMPGLSGHEVADEIRRMNKGEAPYIVCITGRLLRQEEVAAITSDGFNRVLFKPVEFTDIESVLSECSSLRACNTPQDGCRR